MFIDVSTPEPIPLPTAGISLTGISFNVSFTLRPVPNPSSNTASTTLEQQDTRQLAKKIKTPPPDTRTWWQKFKREAKPVADTTFTARADFLPLIYSSETNDKTAEKLISREEAEDARRLTRQEELLELAREMQALIQRAKDNRK
jgi:hypothetical protein